MLPLSCKFSSLTPQTLHMGRYILFMASKNATMCSLKRTFLTGISRGIVKHSGNLCRTVGISASQTGEIHSELLQITHLREENILNSKQIYSFQNKQLFYFPIYCLISTHPYCYIIVMVPILSLPSLTNK